MYSIFILLQKCCCSYLILFSGCFMWDKLAGIKEQLSILMSVSADVFFKESKAPRTVSCCYQPCHSGLFLPFISLLLFFWISKCKTLCLTGQKPINLLNFFSHVPPSLLMQCIVIHRNSLLSLVLLLKYLAVCGI